MRALQERKVTPLGSQREIEVDVRVLATTNRENAQEKFVMANSAKICLIDCHAFPFNPDILAQRPDDIVPISSILLARHSATLGEVPVTDAEAGRSCFYLTTGREMHANWKIVSATRACFVFGCAKLRQAILWSTDALLEQIPSTMTTAKMQRQSANA